MIPEALPPNPTALPSFLANPPRWNDGSETRSAERGARNEDKKDVDFDSANSAFPVPRSAFPDDVAFLVAVIDDTIARLGIDSSRVYVSGFSNGAAMAFRLAAERADRISAIAPVAGYCWVGDPKPSRPVPTLYTVGTADLLVPFRGGPAFSPWHNRLIRRPPLAETLERWAKALGCREVPELVRDEENVCVERYPGPVTFEVVMIEGLGHHWPGGEAQLDPRLAGPPSSTVDATEMICEFFKNLRLTSP